MEKNMRFQFTVLIPILFLYSSGCASPSAKTNDKVATVANANISADENLTALKEGNTRFLSGNVRNEGQSQADVQRLSSGQAPGAVVLSCSDSRVAPEIVFDQKLGEIFTVRTAGEALSDEAIGSIEFAIANLGSKLIVVLGHTDCGAVNAAINTPLGKSVGSKNLDKMIADIKPRLKSVSSSKAPSTYLKDESLENANGVAQDLMKRSQIISSAVNSGKVKISVALYHLHDGTVLFK